MATGEEILEEFLDRICEGEEEDEFQEAFAEGLGALINAGYQFENMQKELREETRSSTQVGPGENLPAVPGQEQDQEVRASSLSATRMPQASIFGGELLGAK